MNYVLSNSSVVHLSIPQFISVFILTLVDQKVQNFCSQDAPVLNN